MIQDPLPKGIVELVVKVILFALGLPARSTYNFIRDYITDRPFRKTWSSIVGSNSTIYIMIAVVPTFDEFGKLTKVVTLPLATALSDLISTLKREYPNLIIEVYPSGNFPAQKLGENLIIVGGPIHNKTCALIQEKIRLPFEFTGFGLIEDQTGNEFRAETDSNGQTSKDFGTVAVFENPFSSSSRICWVAGCHSHGTNASIRSLIKPFVKNLHSKRGHSQYFKMVIETTVADDFVSAPRIVSIAPI